MADPEPTTPPTQTLDEALSAVYAERGNLVALLAALYPSCWNHGDPEWPDWFVVYIELPTGQATWHVSPEDWWIFAFVPHSDTAIWDGHTTAEKYQRIRNLILQIEKGDAHRVPQATNGEASP
jgi:hypothetical protein